MPLIVVGADTGPGTEILERLSAQNREIRVFVSDEGRGLELKNRGFKVATGDVSDDSHVEAASTRCFSAVLVADAAADERERSFADTPQDVLEGWAQAVANSNVKRVIWVITDEPPRVGVGEVATVDPRERGFAEKVVALDEADSLR